MTNTELIKQIEAMMSENEAIKVNAMKAVTTGIHDCENRASIMYCNAKRENVAYQNVLDLIKEG